MNGQETRSLCSAEHVLAERIIFVMKLLKSVKWSRTLCYIFKATYREEHKCLEIQRPTVNSQGLWSHSAMNSCDLFLELLSSPLALTFIRGLIERFPFRVSILQILCCTLTFNPKPWEQPFYSETASALIEVGRGLLLRTACHVAPYPLPFTAIEPSAIRQRNLATRMATSLRAPFVPKDPTCILY